MIRECVAKWLYNTDAQKNPAILFAEQDDNVRSFYLACAKELLAIIAEAAEKEMPIIAATGEIDDVYLQHESDVNWLKGVKDDEEGD